MKIDAKHILAAAAFAGFAMILNATPASANGNETDFIECVETSKTDESDPRTVLENRETETTATYEETGGQYSLDYLTGHYTVVTREDANLNQHGMGQVLVGNDLVAGEFANDPSGCVSYVNGHYTGNPWNAIGDRRAGNDNGNTSYLVLGEGNEINFSEQEGKYVINGDTIAYSTPKNINYIHTNSDFMDFEKLYEAIEAGSQKMAAEGETIDINGEDARIRKNADGSIDILLTVGDKFTLAGIDADNTKFNIRLTGSSTKNNTETTLLNILGDHDFLLDLFCVEEDGKVWSGQEYENDLFCNIFFNLPETTKTVTIANNGYGQHGHIIAPFAHVAVNSGQWAGSVIANSTEIKAEMHTRFSTTVQEEPVQTVQVLTEDPEEETPEVKDPEPETPADETPEVEDPEEETPEIEDPEEETPEVEDPEEETPEVEDPEEETPEVEDPEEETPEVEDPEEETPEVKAPKEKTVVTVVNLDVKPAPVAVQKVNTAAGETEESVIRINTSGSNPDAAPLTATEINTGVAGIGPAFSMMAGLCALLLKKRH